MISLVPFSRMQLTVFLVTILGVTMATEHQQTALRRCSLYETLESAIYVHTVEVGCPLGEFCRADNALCALQYCPYPFGWCLPVNDDEPNLYKLATDVQHLNEELENFRIILDQIRQVMTTTISPIQNSTAMEQTKMPTPDGRTASRTARTTSLPKGPCDHLILQHDYPKMTEALDSCLVLLNGHYSWPEADAACKSVNGQLLYLPTAHELDVFKQVLDEFSSL